VVLSEPLDHLVLVALSGPLDPTVSAVPSVQLGRKVSAGQSELPDHLVLVALSEPLDPRVSAVPSELQDPREPPVRSVLLCVAF